MTEKYTTEFKQNLVRTYLKEYKENAELSFSSYVRENFPEVIMTTAYTWLSLYKNSVVTEQGMSVNEINVLYFWKNILSFILGLIPPTVLGIINLIFINMPIRS